MNWILAVLLIACFLWGTVNKFAIKAFGLYFKKKGYPNPTDEELKECSHEALTKSYKGILSLHKLLCNYKNREVGENDTNCRI